MSDTRPLLTFRLGNQRYALPIPQVVEVMAMVELITLAEMPPAVRGIANRHGEMLPVLDLRAVFGVLATPPTVSTLFIVAQPTGIDEAHPTTDATAQRVGLVVDEVYGVNYVDALQVRAARGVGRFVQELASDGTHLWQIVALQPLLDATLTERTG